MNAEHIIKKQIDKIGSAVTLRDGDWVSVPYKAILSPLWRRKSTNFENSVTQLGITKSEYYLYIGSSDHNITALSQDAMLEMGDEEFEFKHRDVVKAFDKIVYFTGIVRKIRREADDEI